MSSLPLARRRLGIAFREANLEPLNASTPLRRKKLSLARTVRGAILPETIWLRGNGSRLGLTVENRRIYRVEFKIGNRPGKIVNLYGFQDAPDRARTAEKLQQLVDEFLRQDIDLVREFEPLEEDFPSDDGLPVSVLMQPEPRGKPLPDDEAAPQVEAAADEPAAEEDDAAPEVANAVEEPDQKVTTLPWARHGKRPAAPALVEVDTAPEDKAEDRAPEVPAPDGASPQEILAQRLQARLGSPLLVVWMPADRDGDAMAIRADGENREIEEFLPLELGKLLRRWKPG